MRSGTHGLREFSVADALCLAAKTSESLRLMMENDLQLGGDKGYNSTQSTFFAATGIPSNDATREVLQLLNETSSSMKALFRQLRIVQYSRFARRSFNHLEDLKDSYLDIPYSDDILDDTDLIEIRGT